jgi:hypothetical protein
MVRPAWPDRFLKELPKYGTIAGTAKVVKVGRRTVYDEMQRNPDFKADVERIQSECVELVETTLFQQAMDPDKTTDRIFYLKTARPEKYGDGLRADQIRQIREEARRAAIGELEAEILRLPKAARDVVMRALDKQRRELNP